MNIGAILIVDAASDVDFTAVTALVADRLRRVPRLRQRLLDPPLGCGRPVWVDDAAFDLDRHLRETVVRRPPPETGSSEPVVDEEVLALAAEFVCTPLARDRPLWAARWVTGVPRGRAALIFVMHHAMTDGVGGLAVLQALGDEGSGPGEDTFPAPLPRRWSVASAAWHDRLAGLRRTRSRLSTSGQGLRELGLRGRRPRLAASTSLNRPTGPKRRLTTVTMSLLLLWTALIAEGARSTISSSPP